MKCTKTVLPLLAVIGLATACSNPTVDPASKFTVEGDALDADGEPLANATVKLVRYYHPLQLLIPTVEDLFTCDTKDCGYKDLDLEIGLVDEVKTNAEGGFEFEMLGADIAAEQGRTDASGKVEVSDLVAIVFDPNDQKVGVFTYNHKFQQTDKVWNTSEMQLWKAEATAQVNGGLMEFSWNKVERPIESKVYNYYRLEVGKPGGSRYVVRCREGVDATAGGCTESGDKLLVNMSAISVYTFYSNAGSNVTAYVRGASVDFRYQAKFTVPAIPAPNRNKAGLDGIWAVTDAANQPLMNTNADDGDPNTQETINGQAKEIYAKINAAVISDAGLLNGLVNDANTSCIFVEFTSSVYADIDAAKGSLAGDWTSKGKFCGGNFAKEIGAILSFNTNQQAPWLRFRAAPDGTGTPYFEKIGEVAIYAE